MEGWNYDAWKTTPPEPPDVTDCVQCGAEIYKYDHLKTSHGYMCEDCLKLKEEEDGIF